MATGLCPEPTLWTDGVVSLKPPQPGDTQSLVQGRDDEFFRWLGPGSENPAPIACVWVGDELVGWVDYDVERDWLKPGEVNVGYYLFPDARGKGYASRAVELLLLHLDRETEHEVATLLIDRENLKSLALARRLGFEAQGEIDGESFFARKAGRGWSVPGSHR
ncbi:MAG TPA: GNAT family N-acetyltransferase [Gaiellaceae bacterium]|nr:GNAT family N-acetyltransferase [Gaiellaceae bacterium]